MGRPKGAKNKLGVELKEMILQALSNVGGERYLAVQAAKNPTAFLSLVGRVLPLQVKDSSKEPVVPKPVIHEHVS